jgi:UDP-N-acetylglucosamine--N-acetylmuramyl-(pentapeptide) pyrophosphoryl-undecaprenol N-acetylglucosamine transferase
MRILVVTGASGGHIFPALAFLEAVRDRHKDIETLLVLPRTKISLGQIESFGSKVRHISITSINFSLGLKNITAIFDFLRGSLESLILLLEFRPDIVVGFGSLAGIPILLFSWILRIRILLHEQNVIPGRANRLLAKFADRVTVSFAESTGYLHINPQRIVVTGNPLRKSLVKLNKTVALDFFGFRPGKITLLVTGGSQGSHKINTGFVAAVSGLSGKDKIQIIHLAGEREYDSIRGQYKDLGIPAKVFAFFDQMQYAYSAADLVLSRAGATTVAELIFFGLPAIIVPYPFAYKHQSANAGVLNDKGCAVIIKDEELTSQRLGSVLVDAIRDPGRIEQMRRKYDAFPGSCANILFQDAVLSLAAH